MKHKRLTRILALDLHPRSFGYVVIERLTTLLDWGVCRSYRKTKKLQEVLVGRRLRPLLKIWMPDVIVARVGERRSKSVESLFRQMKKEINGTPFRPITVSLHYLGRSKYERAVALTTRFPAISCKLRAKRKPWESEHYSMSLFEALAIAVAYRAGNVPSLTAAYSGTPSK
jgi:hypothetical protein